MSRTIDIGYPITAEFYQDFNFPNEKQGDYKNIEVSNSRVEIKLAGYTVFTKLFPDEDNYYSDRSQEYMIDEALQEFTTKLSRTLEREDQ